MKWVYTAINSLAMAVLILVSACGENHPERKEQIANDTHADGCVSYSALLQSQDGARLLLTAGGTPFSGKACTFFSNGLTYTLTSYEEGKREGMWEVYFSNGNLHKRGYVRNGLEDGMYLEFYQDGQLQYEYHYKDGVQTGLWKSWYPDGTSYTERNFADGKVHGKVLVWDEQGRLAKEYDYKNGALIRQQMHFENFE